MGEPDLQAEGTCLCDCSCTVTREALRELVESRYETRCITKNFLLNMTVKVSHALMMKQSESYSYHQA